MRYDPNEPDRFVLPDFPANRTWWNGIKDFVFEMVVTFFSLAFVGMLTIMIVGPLAAMILGVNVFSDPKSKPKSYPTALPE